MAYAAITCLLRTMHQSMELTGCDLKSFYEKIESLRAILEKSCYITGDLEALTSLEAEIAEVAYSAEDMVDTESRNVLLAQNVEERSRAMWEFFFLVEQALACLDCTMTQWMATWDSMKDLKGQTYSLATLPEHTVERPENIMVGRETAFEMMLDQLARGERELEVVSIVGMGGIGKTTLATKLYNDPFIMSHFDIRAKATVSQEHCVRNVLLHLLSSTSDEPFDELADQLQKLLKGKRYLVVIDDIWTTGAWDDINLCFPDCNNGSRVLLTTRNVDVAEYASSGKPPYHMRLMNFDESWSLLYEKVFAKDSFPPEFEQIGKQIALKCGGLPLAIVVIAGLLSKIGKALSEWQSVAENVSLEVSCRSVLALSYHYLPHHLKPCFLYFAILPEDEIFVVYRLVELWAGEGFLKLEETKSIEEVAEKCLKDLIDRSLISIRHSRFDGKIYSCGMHDVTRELCLSEARKMNFVNVLERKSDQNSFAQSIQCSSMSRPELHFQLVRVLDLSLIRFPTFPSGILSLIHLRYLALNVSPRLKQYLGSEEEIPSSIIDIPPSISSLFYLQTFILNLSNIYERKYPFILPSEILMMTQLRDLRLERNYLHYHELTEKSLVLKNLQCLNGWNPWFCNVSVLRLFPNLKKLQILGDEEDFRSRKDLYDFSYLDKLEELTFSLSPYSACFLDRNNAPSGSTPQYPLRSRKKMRGSPPAIAVPSLLLPPPDVFPQNLKNLAFTGPFCLHWKDMSIVGKLPKLESLKLSYIGFTDEEWEVAEEGFPHLKFLLLKYLDIRYWRASSYHFPCLERLFLHSCWYLESIPQDFAEITTLALMDISNCRKLVGNSAEQIQQDIQDNYGGSIQVHITDTV